MSQKGFIYQESQKVRELRELRESNQSSGDLKSTKHLNDNVRPIPEQSQHPNFKTSKKQNHF